jgi:hypothetical protein
MPEAKIQGFMIKLGTKISGPCGIGIMVGLLDLAAILFVGLVGVMHFDQLSTSSFDVLTIGLLGVLTFPANLFHYSYETALGGGSINFYFLNPLIWGLIAFFFRRATKPAVDNADRWIAED